MLGGMSRGHFAAALAAATLSLAAPAAASANSFPLEGWWPMNEGSGQTVKDWSGNANHGFLGTTTAVDDADPSWIRGVLLGSALRFSGGDMVTIPDSASLRPENLTVAAWVRGDGSPGSYKYVVSKGFYTCWTASYGLYTGSGGGMAFYIANGAYDFYASPAAPASIWDGKWHHVAGTFDGGVVRLYVDGAEVGTGTPAPVTIDYGDYRDPDAHAGSHEPDDCSQDLTLKGDVDGLQIWSQALPVDRIWRTLKALVSLAR
jgi:hypothetical protein